MTVYPLMFSVRGAFALTGFAILHNVAFIAVSLSVGVSSAVLTMVGKVTENKTQTDSSQSWPRCSTVYFFVSAR